MAIFKLLITFTDIEDYRSWLPDKLKEKYNQ